MHPYHLVICTHCCRAPFTHPHLMSISLADTTLGAWSLRRLQYIVVTPNSYKKRAAMLWGRLDAASPPSLSLLKSHAGCIKSYHSHAHHLYHWSGLLHLSLLRPLKLLIVATSLSLLCHLSSPQPLMLEPTLSDFCSEKLGNHTHAFHCSLRECKTSLLIALKLTARSLPTLPSQCNPTLGKCHLSFHTFSHLITDIRWDKTEPTYYISYHIKHRIFWKISAWNEQK